MAGDNLSKILEMVRAELHGMGVEITLEQMRQASLGARREYKGRRVYVDGLPKLQKLTAACSLPPDSDTRSIADALGCSERHARTLRAWLQR